MAIKTNNIEAVNLLLTNDNIDVNLLNTTSYSGSDTKKTALYYAVEKRKTDAVKALLTNDNIDVNIICGEEECEVYEDEDGYPNQRTIITGETALHRAVQNGSIEIVKLLLSNPKIDINELDLIFFKNWNNIYFNFLNDFISIILWRKPIEYAARDEIRQLLNH